MDKMRMFVKAIYAGFAIGIGGIIYLSVDNKVLASLFFSFGLSTIVTQGFNLYTGKIGFVKEWREMPDMMLILAGNFMGTFIAAMLAKAANLGIDSTQMVHNKLDNSLIHVFLLSVFCGVMMYLAIDNYNKSKNIVFVIAAVMIFILSGFEHSIANMFYFEIANAYSLKSLLYILVMAAGNGVGAKIFGLMPK
ncbi:MAG: formate/nitrite transporter family protein [Lachnospiraceae bacterium]|jgi:nitrite transporter NirC|nr:formate/nitrite transporter family protein [Lachnospiraceae bacterium]